MTVQNFSNEQQLVIVSNRLPVDRVVDDSGEVSWLPSPGGLVTAMEPIVRELGCQWIGWSGSTDDELEPFEIDSMHLSPVSLSKVEHSGYYEGFSNATLWPLYHDVITPPVYDRSWWDHYRSVNRRFTERIAAEASQGAVVWVHDYQLQLVPAMLRDLRPDLTIAFFLHIPFPSTEIFAQLPWRTRVIEGLLGADVIGFQRGKDAANFRELASGLPGTHVDADRIRLHSHDGAPTRTVTAREFPISIDMHEFSSLAQRPDIQERAAEIRRELGTERTILLGVDRLDYTKGIRHRLLAFEELLSEQEFDPSTTVLVQIASPSREHVDAYRALRDEVDLTVGRINGEYGTLEHVPIVYLYRGHSREEMAAMYLAADVLVVSPLRDGMNLVAKEYVACRNDESGVLILSEFAGAADELTDSLLINPHDIEGLKAAMLRAAHMPAKEQQRRMRRMRLAVRENDVADWADRFLREVHAARERTEVELTRTTPTPRDLSGDERQLTSALEAELQRMAHSPALLVACDFDGTIAPIVPRPQDARILPAAQSALTRLSNLPNTTVVVLTGRGMESLRSTQLEATNWIISASHGAEFGGMSPSPDGTMTELTGGALSEDEQRLKDWISNRLMRVLSDEPGVRFEEKPLGIALHVREVADAERATEVLETASALGAVPGLEERRGKMVREFVVRAADKGSALHHIRTQLGQTHVLFFGDDVTDEDVFATLGAEDVGIKVGEGDTFARERVADPTSVASALQLLADAREDWLSAEGPTRVS